SSYSQLFCFPVLCMQPTLQSIAPSMKSTLTLATGSVRPGPGNGGCTLRAAAQETNALTGADAITLPAGTFTLFLALRLVVMPLGARLGRNNV
ncbi:MAG: hypothetical protein MN733_23485, partial [Nitrososphaera sp.]|nr:hypothetical protein [Nitrososphaera sp.]